MGATSKRHGSCCRCDGHRSVQHARLVTTSKHGGRPDCLSNACSHPNKAAHLNGHLHRIQAGQEHVSMRA